MAAFSLEFLRCLWHNIARAEITAVHLGGYGMEKENGKKSNFNPYAIVFLIIATAMILMAVSVAFMITTS